MRRKPEDKLIFEFLRLEFGKSAAKVWIKKERHKLFEFLSYVYEPNSTYFKDLRHRYEMCNYDKELKKKWK